MADTGVGVYLMVDEELGLIAHLLRRAGFGATLEELEAVSYTHLTLPTILLV